MKRAHSATEFRRPGLDRLRVGVMLGVVILHAAIPYVAHPLPGLTWPTRHSEPSERLDVLLWTLLLLVMPLFFWLSGYGAAQSIGRDGPWAFLQSRWQRIGKPALMFAAILLPIELHVWVGGWVLDGLVPLTKLRSFKLGIFDAGLWGPSNLWYLQNLLLYCGLLAIWRSVVRPRSLRVWTDARPSIIEFVSERLHRIERWMVRIWPSAAASLLIILPASVLLSMRPAILLGFEHAWLPEPLKFVWLGMFFAAGVVTQQIVQRDPTAFSFRAARSVFDAGLVLLVLAAPVLILYLEHPSAVLIHPRLTANPDPAQFAWTFRFLLGGLIAAGVVLTTRGLTEVALSDNRSSSVSLQRWSRASYWIYLIHHPFVAACHLVLNRTGWPADVQFILAASLTLGFSWGTYCGLVEHTSVGTFLDGRRPYAPPPEVVTISRRAA